MNKKNLTYLSLLFVVLLAVYMISSMTDRTIERKAYLYDIDTTKVDYFRIVSPDNGEVTIELVNDVWRITEPISFPAAARNAHEFLKKLTELEIESVVSNRIEMQTEFEVDSAGTIIEVKSKGKTLAYFFMGKVSSTYRHTYFRKNNSNEILMVKGSFKFYFNRKLGDWRNKVILEMNKDAVESFALKYPKETINVTMEDTLWRADNGKESFIATKKAVEPLLNYLAKLRASDFYDPEEGAEPIDFSNADCEMEVTYDGGKVLSILLMKENDEAKKYYIKKSDSDIVYMVFQGTANILMKKMDDFRMKDQEQPKTPPPPKKLD